MAIEVTDQHGFVVLPPKLKYTRDGRSYVELVVNFGSKKADHWYVRVWKEHLVTSVMRIAVKDAFVVVSGSMSKWQHLGGGYGVALNAETLEVKRSIS
jgi:hypothetical protein